MIASSYETGTAKVGMRVDGLLVSMQAIVTLLQGAGINPDVTLIPPEEPGAQESPRWSPARSGSPSVEGTAAAAAALKSNIVEKRTPKSSRTGKVHYAVA